MDPDEASVPRPAAVPGDRAERLSASARGWHTIQMAVLGFIGICGILRTTSSSAPRAIQWLAGALAVAALAVACIAVLTIGRIAYPIDDALDGDRAVASGTPRLRAGIRLTVAALILAVIAALSGWWPSPTSSPAVAVTGTTGQAWCGPLVSGPADTISVRTANGVIIVPAQAIAQVSPVDRCP
jgi:hypothetical protein